jgi:hypothetical protein
MTTYHNNRHDTINDPRLAQPNTGTGRRKRKPYSAPKLELYGDIRSLTLGGSPGSGDSGGPLVTQPPGIP